jgi:hypothetical protein
MRRQFGRASRRGLEQSGGAARARRQRHHRSIPRRRALHIGIGESFSPSLDVQQVIVNDSVANNSNAVDPGAILPHDPPHEPVAQRHEGVASATARLNTTTRA